MSRVLATSNDKFKVIAKISKGSSGSSGSFTVGMERNCTSGILPEGYLFCDGQAISRTIYSNLFAVISTTFGSGDGSTTFNLPDRRATVDITYDSRDTDFANFNNRGGAKTLTLALANLPSHNHTFTGTALGTHNHTQSAHTHTEAAHNHTHTGSHNHTDAGIQWAHSPGNYYAARNGGSGNWCTCWDHGGRGDIWTSATTPANNNTTQSDNSVAATNIAISAGTPSGTVSNSGSGTAFNKLPPYTVSRKMIKY